MTPRWLNDNSFRFFSDGPFQFVPRLLEGDSRIFLKVRNGCILNKVVIFFGGDPGFLVEVSLNQCRTSKGFADCHRKLR